VNEILIYGRHLSRITRSQELEEAAARVQQEVTAALEEAERVGNPGTGGCEKIDLAGFSRFQF
jgi:hypothetical protein